MKEPGRKNTTDSFMWVYTSIKDSKKPVRIFKYCAGRSGNFAKEFLGEKYSGYVHTDAYAGYGKVPNITRCYCWAHLRRYFVDAIEKGLANPSETIPGVAIKKIGEIFEADKQLNDLPEDKRYIQRLDKVKPLIEAFWSWVDSVPQNEITGSKLKKALFYASNHKTEFMNFLKDGNCSLSNNLAENSIRPFTIGRKNWLFSGSPKGAEASAGVYTLIETAKANGLNPRKYIEYILGDIPGSAFKENPEFLEDYLPWNPTVQELCK